MRYLITRYFLPRMGLLCLVAVVFSSCGSSSKGVSPEHIAKGEMHRHEAGSLCESFYDATNAEWLSKNPVPASETRWGCIEMLRKNTFFQWRDLVTSWQTASQASLEKEVQMVLALHTSVIDTVAIEEREYEEIEPIVQEIMATKTSGDVVKLIRNLQKHHWYSLVPLYVRPDKENNTVNQLYMGQAGLSFGEKSYYDGSEIELKNAWMQWVMKVTNALEINVNESDWEQVWNLETELASTTLDKVERRDPYATYNIWTFDSLDQSAPNIAWRPFLNEILGSIPKQCIVSQPNYLRGIHKALMNYDPQTWKLFFLQHVTKRYAKLLPEDIRTAHFLCFENAWRGKKKRTDRMEYSKNLCDSYLGEEFGKQYVKKHFPEEQKQVISQMIEEIRGSFKERIEENEWMSQETKVQAFEKLSTFRYKIGYPDHWKERKPVALENDKPIKNLRHLKGRNWTESLAKIGQEVDVSEWFMAPQIVNAYYNSQFNEIVFPAGILQPPFYDVSASQAQNYGGIGAVIGHEFSHGFDDQGSKYDAKGKLKSWWTSEDRARFEARTETLASHYDSVEVLPEVFINGKFTLGENIADLGGLIVAFHALMNSLQEGEDKQQAAEEFFYGWSLIWRNNILDKELERRIATDPHSPGRARVNEPLRHMEEYYTTFSCDSTSTMYLPKEKRARIW